MSHSKLSSKLYQERYRPQFHFSAREGWLNDPNGLVYHQGEYHLFFQHNPFGNEWGHMTWGHAVSQDLLHWEQLEHALEPDETGMMFSGSAVVDWRNSAGLQTGDAPSLILAYTAAGSFVTKGLPFTQCLAYSNDRGRSWTKYQGNPVIGDIAVETRDPKIIWHEASQRWVMALFIDEPHHFALYASNDLKDWHHLQNLDIPGTRECPDFFPITVDGSGEEKWIYIGADGKYLIGDFDGQRFAPESDLLSLDYARAFYACQTFSDIPQEDGRRIQIAWLREGSYPDMPFSQHMNFPCELSLKSTPQGLRLYRWPIAEIERLYQKSDVESVAVDNAEHHHKLTSSGLLDIELELNTQGLQQLDINIHNISCHFDAEERRFSCLDHQVVLEEDSPELHIRLLVDQGSLEVFLNGGRYCLSYCHLMEMSDGLSFTIRGKAQIECLAVHELRSSWPVDDHHHYRI